MALHEQGFHSLPILARLQRNITCPLLDIDGSVEVGMGLEATDHTTKGLLIRAIRLVGIMARCYVDTCNLVAHLFVLKAGKCAS